MTVSISLLDQTKPAPNPPPTPVTIASHPTDTTLVLLTVGDQTRTVLASELVTAANRAKKA